MAEQKEEMVVVYGGGGHGKVVADICLAMDLELYGFVDDGARGDFVMGLPVLGSWNWLAQQRPKTLRVALGIGRNDAREKVANRCVEAGFELVVAVHPTSVVSPFATLGAGATVMAGAVVNPGAAVGRGAIINTAAVVEHDVTVGDFAHLSPNAATGGAAKVGPRAHLGLGASLLPLVAIGADTVVGAGAVVNRDLPPSVVAYGVPARIR